MLPDKAVNIIVNIDVPIASSIGSPTKRLNIGTKITPPPIPTKLASIPAPRVIKNNSIILRTLYIGYHLV